MKRKSLLLLAALAGCWMLAAWAVDSARIVRATDMRDAPYTDARMLELLRAETTVEILERQGGWYHVKLTDSGRQGWVRMSSLRMEQTAEAQAGAGWFASLFRAGRSSATWTTATTGIRGLKAEDIANAAPDFDEVEQLNGYAASPADARTFAADLKLRHQQIAYLPEPEDK